MKRSHSLAVCGLAVLIGVLMIFHGTSNWRAGRASANWPVAPGAVTQSYLRKVKSRHTISYSYTVDGREYTGTRKQFGQSARRTIADLRDVKTGDAVKVHYNPKDPAQSTLKTGAHPNVYFFWVLGLTFTIGPVIGWRKYVQRGSAADQPGNVAPEK